MVGDLEKNHGGREMEKKPPFSRNLLICSAFFEILFL